MKINELEVTVKSFKPVSNLLTFTVEGNVGDIIDEVKNGGAVIENGNVVYGDYSVFICAVINKDGSVTVTLKKPETWREALDRLNAENEALRADNEALRAELLDTQEALAEIVESVEETSEESEEAEEEGGEQDG